MKKPRVKLLAGTFLLLGIYWCFAVATSRVPRPLYSGDLAAWEGDKISFNSTDSVDLLNPYILLYSAKDKSYAYTKEITVEAGKTTTLLLEDFEDLKTDKTHKKKFRPQRLEIRAINNRDSKFPWGFSYVISQGAITK